MKVTLLGCRMVLGDFVNFHSKKISVQLLAGIPNSVDNGTFLNRFSLQNISR